MILHFLKHLKVLKLFTPSLLLLPFSNEPTISSQTTGAYVAKLALGGITKAEDLLRYFPRAYEDRTQIKRLQDIILDESVQTVK